MQIPHVDIITARLAASRSSLSILIWLSANTLSFFHFTSEQGKGVLAGRNGGGAGKMTTGIGGKLLLSDGGLPIPIDFIYASTD